MCVRNVRCVLVRAVGKDCGSGAPPRGDRLRGIVDADRGVSRRGDHVRLLREGGFRK